MMQQFAFRAVYLVLCALNVLSSNALTNSVVKQIKQPASHRTALPSILIIGTAKSGTTDLYEQLADDSVNQDPQRPEPPLLRGPSKEIYFLGRSDLSTADLAPGGRWFFEYLRLLGHPCANTSAEAVAGCVNATSARLLTLDANPANLMMPAAPANLAALSPHSKVLVLLRDPVERAEMLFRHVNLVEGQWLNTTIDALTDAFFHYLETTRTKGAATASADAGATAAAAPPLQLQLQLQALSNCNGDVGCMARGWAAAMDLHSRAPMEVRLFTGGLYPYALAVWRQQYFQPGAVMVVDAYSYFEDRCAALEQVVKFLYDRPMTGLERANSVLPSFWRKGPKALSRAGTSWQLSAARRARLQSFYDEHVLRLLGRTLREMRAEGAAVVGFDRDPWVSNAHFEFITPPRR